MQNALNYLYNYWHSDILPMFKLKYLRADISAAIAVTFVAIPLSLAIALASAVPAYTALIAAVFGGILGAIFGGTRLGVTGPAVAMSVLVAATVVEFGFSGVLVAGMVCGGLQIICGLAQVGRLVKLIPLSLVLAFTAGIGFLLFLQLLPIIFELSHPQGNLLWGVLSQLPLYWQHLGATSVLLTLLTVVILTLVPRILPLAYTFILAVVVPMLVVHFAQLSVTVVGHLPYQLLQPRLMAVQPDYAEWYKLFLTGVEMFMLASLETLLSASAVDLMGKGDLHNSNQELFGQGVANLGSAFFGGLPVTGIIARSSINVLAGAKTRRAAILHALLVLLIISVYPQIIELMPVAVLAGILLAAAFKMMNFQQVLELWRADRWEVAVYVITLVVIIATDLNDGIQAGLLAAFIIVAVRTFNNKAEIKLWTNNSVLRATLAGNISFFSYAKLAKIKERALAQTSIKVVVFEFGNLQNIDASGAQHLINIAQELTAEKIKVIFHNISDEQREVIVHNTFRGVSANSNKLKPYVITLAEYEIKAILEQAGIIHSANDVLRHGVTKYISHYAKDNQRLLNTLAQGQKPHTLLITCSDSRLNPNAFFSANIGEVFIVRNVGNVIPPCMPQNIYGEIAALEYAIHELGIRNIVICAHTECGAIKASLASGDKELGYIGLDNWLSIIKNGFRRKMPADASQGVEFNLLNQVENLKTYPWIDELIAQQKLIINAWIYNVHSGHMLEWCDAEKHFIPMA